MKIFNVVLSLVVIIAIASCGGGGGSTDNAATTYAISGTVISAGTGTALQGVTMSLISSSGTTTTNTGVNGAYSFSGLAKGNYTVVPAKTGYTLNPISSAAAVSSTNITGKNFTATVNSSPTYTISGTVSGSVVKDVLISLNGDATGSTFTDANGSYTFSGLVAGSYTVTPSKTGYSFGPAGAVTISAANSTGNNFTSAIAPVGGSLSFSPVASLPQASTGVAYTQSIIGSITGGSSPYHYQSDSFMTGAPPIGMIVDLNGNLTGTPSVAGTYNFGVCAVDIAGASSCGMTSIVVLSVKTYSGSFSGSGTFSRAFPAWSTTCTFNNTFSGTITVTMTTALDGTISSSTHVAGTWDSIATSGSTIDFTCLDTNLAWDNTIAASGILPVINWTDIFSTPGGSTVTGTFTGTLSGATITGTQIETIDTSTGSASIPITLTKQ